MDIPGTPVVEAVDKTDVEEAGKADYEVVDTADFGVSAATAVGLPGQHLTFAGSLNSDDSAGSAASFPVLRILQLADNTHDLAPSSSRG